MQAHCSPKGVSFIIGQEDGDQQYYQRTEEHWDWPGGSSGPTIGVGYDCGYVTREECTTDWTGIVDDDTLANILRGVGITGDKAHIFVNNNRHDVTVTWAQAVNEFTNRELPKWENRCRLVLPNFDLLSGDCCAAITSLSYNRGTGGYRSTLPRYKEMNEIYDYMKSGKFAYIPTAIASMQRLWPTSFDLRRRRQLEAGLFIEGMSLNQVFVKSSPPQAATS